MEKPQPSHIILQPLSTFNATQISGVPHNITLISSHTSRIRRINTINKIYKYIINSTCKAYFKIPSSIKIICIIINEIAYFIKLDESFSIKDDFLTSINSIELEHIQGIVKPRCSRPRPNQINNIETKLKDYLDFYYVPYDTINNNIYCPLVTNIETINNLISIIVINNIRFELNYIFEYNDKGITEITSFAGGIEIDPFSLLLCIIFNNKCISSLIIKYDYDENIISFESETHTEHLRKGYNKMLIAMLIMYSKTLYPAAVSVNALSINPVTHYILGKYFRAQVRYTASGDYEEYNNKLTSPTNSEYVDCKVVINEFNITNAKKIFEKQKKTIIPSVGGAIFNRNKKNKSKSRNNRKKKQKSRNNRKKKQKSRNNKKKKRKSRKNKITF